MRKTPAKPGFFFGGFKGRRGRLNQGSRGAPKWSQMGRTPAVLQAEILVVGLDWPDRYAER